MRFHGVSATVGNLRRPFASGMSSRSTSLMDGRPARRHRAPAAAVLFAAIALVSSVIGGGVAAASGGSGALIWSAPVQVDGQPPYAAPDPLSPSDLTAISCPTTTLCVAVGTSENLVREPYLLQDEIVTSTNPVGGASAWSTAVLSSSLNLTAVSCPTASFCVAVGSGGQGQGSQIVTSTNPAGGPSAWTVADLSGTDGPESVSCASSVLCVAGDGLGGALVSTDPIGGASAWTASSSLTNAGDVYGTAGVSCVTGPFCAVTGNGYVFTSSDPTGGSPAWTHSSANVGAISCSSNAMCAGAGNSGIVVSADPASATPTWQSTTLSGASNLVSVSCPVDSFCVAVDDSGNAFASSDPAAASPVWTQVQADPYGPLQGVSCPTTTLCVGVGDLGDVVTSVNPGASTPTWTVAQPNRSYSLDRFNALMGMSCPSSTFCAGVDDAGNVVTSADPAGGQSSWSEQQIGDSGVTADQLNVFTGVSCPSASFCAVAATGRSFGGYTMFTSSDPTGGTLSWQGSYVDNGNALSGVSCPGTSLCVAVDGTGDVVTSTDPTAGSSSTWTVQQVDASSTLDAVSCPTTTLCVAVDQQGDVATSTNPAAASPTWTMVDIDGTQPLYGVSCSSASLCVAVDGAGNAVSSTNPAGGAAAWTATTIDGQALTAVSCAPSGGLCVAVDGAGNVLTSTAPASSTSWTVAKVDPDLLGAASCPTTTLCVLGDGNGGIVTATGSAPSVQVYLDGSGGGTVTSAPSGIDCPGTCSAQFPNGQQLTLTVTPDSRSILANISGCSGPVTVNPVGEQCALTTSVTATTDVYVDFEPVTAVLSASDAPTQNGGTLVETTVNGCNSTNAASYSWTVDDNPYFPSTDTAQCSFVYGFTVGTHTVSLAVTDPSGTRTSVTTIQVNVPPVAGFTWTIQPNTVGGSTSSATVIFDACTQSGGIASYSWQEGSGTPQAGGCEVSNNLPNNTSTTITLVATGTNGQKVTVSEPIYVDAPFTSASGCNLSSLGPDGCIRQDIATMGDVLGFGSSFRQPDYVVAAISGGLPDGATGTFSVAITCDGSIYGGVGLGVGLGESLPITAVFSFGYVGDPTTTWPSNVNSNSIIDNFVSGATLNVGLAGAAAGITGISSPGASAPYNWGEQYDTGVVGLLNLNLSASYSSLIKAGNGSPNCTGGALESSTWQQLTNTAQQSGAGLTSVNLSAPASGSVSASDQVTFNVVSTGWEPGTDVTVTAHSTSVTLAVLPADDQGDSSINVELPARFPPGPHTLIETGWAPDGSPRSLSVPLTVTGPDEDLALTNVPTDQTVDATSPAGAVVNYTRPTASDGDDASPPGVTCSTPPGSTFPIGTTDVTCGASDTDDTPSSVSQSFTVTVKGAAQQLSDLSQEVQAVGPGNSLAAKVSAARSALASNDTATACDDLGSLIDEVEAQAGKKIPNRTASRLVADSRRIQAVLGCGS